VSDDLLDEYDRLIRPDFYKEVDLAWQSHVDLKAAMAMMAAAYSDLSGGDLSEGKLRELQRDRVRRHLSQFDDAILKALGMSVEDLIDFYHRRLAETRAGRMKPQSAERRETRRQALLAIREADLRGLGWTEAIAFVQNSLQSAGRPEIDRKTLDKWMRELSAWNLIKVFPPPERGRGRPKKGIGG
jgi:hypothetical protein